MDNERREVYEAYLARLNSEQLDRINRYAAPLNYWSKEFDVPEWVIKTYHQQQQLKRDVAVGALCFGVMALAGLTAWLSVPISRDYSPLEDRVVAPVISQDY